MSKRFVYVCVTNKNNFYGVYATRFEAEAAARSSPLILHISKEEI